MKPSPPIPTFPIGSVVYLRVAPEEFRGMVTGYMVRPGGMLIYCITWGEDATEKWHWAMELTEDASYKPCTVGGAEDGG